MTLDEIIAKVAESTGLPKVLVERTYRAYWRSIREYIVSLPLKDDLSDEEFNKLKTSVNIPSIGKLYVSAERYRVLKNIFNNRNKEKGEKE